MSDLSPDLVVAAMRKLGYRLDMNPGEVNIFYVEGMNRDGTPNDDAPDKWNDLRGVITFPHAILDPLAPRRPFPVMAGLWDNVTTKPGFYYDRTHVINVNGAAIIALGQQTAWRVGYHHQDPERPALVQTGGDVAVYRDAKHDFSRSGTPDVGDFGINQHDGQDGDPSTIGRHSAGCLVVRSIAAQAAFMAIVKSDPRYVADRAFVFSTTVLRAADLVPE